MLVKGRNVPVIFTQMDQVVIAPSVFDDTREYSGTGSDLAEFAGLTEPIFVPDQVIVKQRWVAGCLVSEEISGLMRFDALRDDYHASHFKGNLIMPLSSQIELIMRVMMFAAVIKRLSRHGVPPKLTFAQRILDQQLLSDKMIQHGDEVLVTIGGYHQHPDRQGQKQTLVADGLVLLRTPEDPPFVAISRGVFEAMAPGLMSTNKDED